MSLGDNGLTGVQMPGIIYSADFGEMVRDRKKLSSVLDSAPQKSI
jgi:hypothetical protein